MPASRKAISVILATAVAAAAFAACGPDNGESSTASRASDTVAGATPGSGHQTLSSEGVSGAPASSPGEKPLSTEQGANTGGSGGLPASTTDFARKVIISATMSLNVKDVPVAFAEASRLARAAGGYVEKSSFINVTENKDAPQRTASITLRIPAAQYEATLTALRTIDGAKVQSEGSKSSEVTEQYTDLQSRLRNLERTEGQYLKLLDQAKTIPEILQLQDRLDTVRGQIEQIQGRLKVLDQLVDFTTIDVAMAPFPIAAAGTGDSTSLRHVFATAWEQSVATAGYVAAFAIYAGVALIWLALPVGVVLLVYRHSTRKATPPTPAA
ncbi:MAG: DUF4349 domain-containing protein [Anaerolineaceae bacterium]